MPTQARRVFTEDFFSAPERKEIANVKVSFPVPSAEATLKDFFQKSANGKKYKKGVAHYLERLKAWATKNGLPEEVNIHLDSFYEKHINPTEGENPAAEFTLLSYGVLLLSGMVDLITGYQLQFPKDPPRMRSDVELNEAQVYLAGENLEFAVKNYNGRIKRTRIQEVELGVETYQRIKTALKQAQPSNISVEDENALYDQLAKKGYPRPANSEVNERNKEIIKALCSNEGDSGLIVCTEGTCTNISNAFIKVSGDLRLTLMGIRQEIAGDIIEEDMRTLEKRYPGSIHPLLPPHYINSALNKNTQLIGLPVMEDFFIQAINKKVDEVLTNSLKQKFEKKMTLETLIDNILFKLDLESLKSKLEAKEDRIRNLRIRDFEEAISVYGKDKEHDMNPYYDIDAMLEGRTQASADIEYYAISTIIKRLLSSGKLNPDEIPVFDEARAINKIPSYISLRIYQVLRSDGSIIPFIPYALEKLFSGDISTLYSLSQENQKELMDIYIKRLIKKTRDTYSNPESDENIKGEWLEQITILFEDKKLSAILDLADPKFEKRLDLILAFPENERMELFKTAFCLFGLKKSGLRRKASESIFTMFFLYPENLYKLIQIYNESERPYIFRKILKTFNKEFKSKENIRSLIPNLQPLSRLLMSFSEEDRSKIIQEIHLSGEGWLNQIITDDKNKNPSKNEFISLNIKALEKGDFDGLECLFHIANCRPYVEELREDKKDNVEKGEQTQEFLRVNLKGVSPALKILIYCSKFNKIKWFTTNNIKAKEYFFGLIKSLSQDEANYILFNTDIFSLLLAISKTKSEILSALYEKTDQALLAEKLDLWVRDLPMSKNKEIADIKHFQSFFPKNAKNVILNPSFFEVKVSSGLKDEPILAWAISNKIDLDCFRTLITNLPACRFARETLESVLLEASKAGNGYMAVLLELLHPEDKEHALKFLIEHYLNSPLDTINKDSFSAVLLQLKPEQLTERFLASKMTKSLVEERPGIILTAAAEKMKNSDFKNFISRINKKTLETVSKSLIIDPIRLNALIEIASLSTKNFEDNLTIVRDEISQDQYIDYLNTALNLAKRSKQYNPALINFLLNASPEIVNVILNDDLGKSEENSLLKQLFSSVDEEFMVQFMRKGNPERVDAVLMDSVKNNNKTIFAASCLALDPKFVTRKYLTKVITYQGEQISFLAYASRVLSISQFENFISSIQPETLAEAASETIPESKDVSILDVVAPISEGAFCQAIVEEVGDLIDPSSYLTIFEKDIQNPFLSTEAFISLLVNSGSEGLQLLFSKPKLADLAMNRILELSKSSGYSEDINKIVEKVDQDLLGNILLSMTLKVLNNDKLSLSEKSDHLYLYLRQVPPSITDKLLSLLDSSGKSVLFILVKTYDNRRKNDLARILTNADPMVINGLILGLPQGNISFLSSVLDDSETNVTFKTFPILAFLMMAEKANLTEAEIQDEILLAFKSIFNHPDISNAILPPLNSRKESFLSLLNEYLQVAKPEFVDELMQIKNTESQQSLFSWLVQNNQINSTQDSLSMRDFISFDKLASKMTPEILNRLSAIPDEKGNTPLYYALKGFTKDDTLVFLSRLNSRTFETCFNQALDKGVNLLTTAILYTNKDVFPYFISRISSDLIYRALVYGIDHHDYSKRLLTYLLPDGSSDMGRASYGKNAGLRNFKTLLLSAPCIMSTLTRNKYDYIHMYSPDMKLLDQLCDFTDPKKAKSNILTNPGIFITFLSSALIGKKPAAADFEFWQGILQTAMQNAKNITHVEALNNICGALNTYINSPTGQHMLTLHQISNYSTQLNSYIEKSKKRSKSGGLFKFTVGESMRFRIEITKPILIALNQEPRDWVTISTLINFALANSVVQNDKKLQTFLQGLSKSIQNLLSQFPNLEFERKFAEKEGKVREEKEREYKGDAPGL